MSDPRVPDDWTVIVETHDGTEADLIRGRLHEEGIEAVVLESRAAPGAWLTGSQPHWAPKSVAVPIEEHDRALDLLAADEDLGEQDDALGSGYDVSDVASTIGTVSEPPDERPTMLGWLRFAAWVIAALVLVPLVYGQCPGPM